MNKNSTIWVTFKSVALDWGLAVEEGLMFVAPPADVLLGLV